MPPLKLFKKPITACPFCYLDIDVSRVAFRCSGQGEPGRPACLPVVDQTRKNLLGYSEPARPTIVDSEHRDILARNHVTCPSCHADSTMRLCPSCHTPLPHGFSAGSPMIGMVGARNSGKTVLLSILHTELTRNVARRFNASISNPGGTEGLSQDLDIFQKRMRTGSGALPEQTPATAQKSGTKKPPAVYEWKYEKKGRTDSTIFSFYDTAGEDLQTQEQALTQQYLGRASGMILLLDPFSFPENFSTGQERHAVDAQTASPETVLDGITYMLQTSHKVKRNKKIDIPVAVVISKIDAFFDQIPVNHPLRSRGSEEAVFDDHESRTISDHVASMINGWGGDTLLRKLEQNYANVRFFGVSALGAEPNYRDSTVNSRGVLPLHVADPLLWLMADRRFIPTTGEK